MKSTLTILAVAALFLCSCDDNNDKTQTINKDGGIEVALSTLHIDSLKDLVTTHYTVWRKGTKVSEFDKKDTVPSLGKFVATSEDDSGNTQDVNINKDYEFFVTVK